MFDKCILRSCFCSFEIFVPFWKNESPQDFEGNILAQSWSLTLSSSDAPLIRGAQIVQEVFEITIALTFSLKDPIFSSLISKKRVRQPTLDTLNLIV